VGRRLRVRKLKAHPESILVLFVGMLLSEVVAVPGIVWQIVDTARHNGHPSTEALLLRWSLEVVNSPSRSSSPWA